MKVRPHLFTNEVTLTRNFHASPAQVFRAWTDGLLLASWWGPGDFTNPVCFVDARPGGALEIEMRAPDGVIYPVKGRFCVVDEFEQLVFVTYAFYDETGMARLKTLNTIVFVPEPFGSRLTLQAVVLRSVPAVAAVLDLMEPGWSQSLDKLERLIRGMYVTRSRGGLAE